MGVGVGVGVGWSASVAPSPVQVALYQKGQDAVVASLSPAAGLASTQEQVLPLHLVSSSSRTFMYVTKALPCIFMLHAMRGRRVPARPQTL